MAAADCASKQLVVCLHAIRLKSNDYVFCAETTLFWKYPKKSKIISALCVSGLSSCFSADKLIKANVQLEESIPCIAPFKSHIIFRSLEHHKIY